MHVEKIAKNAVMTTVRHIHPRLIKVHWHQRPSAVTTVTNATAQAAQHQTLQELPQAQQSAEHVTNAQIPAQKGQLLQVVHQNIKPFVQVQPNAEVLATNADTIMIAMHRKHLAAVIIVATTIPAEFAHPVIIITIAMPQTNHALMAVNPPILAVNAQNVKKGLPAAITLVIMSVPFPVEIAFTAIGALLIV